MNYINLLTVLFCAYLIGSIPFGLIIVKILKGHDIRTIQSGRTGGTNVGRAAGFGAGALTGVLDFFKAVIAVMIAQELIPDGSWRPWVIGASGLLVILGHNYSVFLMERLSPGKFRLRGGAGGAACLGGSVAMYPPALLILLPAVLLVLLGVGYASLATLSIAFIAFIIFTIRAIYYGASWAYAIYALLAQVLLVIALIPNIKRLIQGNERVVGIRTWIKAKQDSKNNPD
ncbi:MAG: hypothetical protein C0391_02900 [Anaerolinea sp.]|nr:hypothetical protein [Anaerolinea sp.]